MLMMNLNYDIGNTDYTNNHIDNENDYNKLKIIPKAIRKRCTTYANVQHENSKF